jgi:fungal type III polyketide synthase
VKLSVEASRTALAEWGGDPADLTHVVAVTCTNSANPGFDHYVVKQLGLNTSIEKVLLHGVGCSGGLAALRTAANLAHGASFRGKPARILVLACEITSLLVRSELDSIAELQETRIGVTLFSDCASAVVLGNDLGESLIEEPLLELLGWDHRIIDDTENDLGFDVDPSGIYTSLPFFSRPLSVISSAILPPSTNPANDR